MKKGKIRFNFLDVLIILAVFLLILGIIWREELTEKIETRNIENTVTVSCGINAYVPAENEDGAYAVKFGEGKTDVYLDDAEAGYIETVVVQTAEESSGDSSADGDAQQTVEETTLYLKVVSRESGYYIGGETKLLLGGEYLFHTKTEQFFVKILSISE